MASYIIFKIFLPYFLLFTFSTHTFFEIFIITFLHNNRVLLITRNKAPITAFVSAGVAHRCHTVATSCLRGCSPFIVGFALAQRRAVYKNFQIHDFAIITQHLLMPHKKTTTKITEQYHL